MDRLRHNGDFQKSNHMFMVSLSMIKQGISFILIKHKFLENLSYHNYFKIPQHNLMLSKSINCDRYINVDSLRSLCICQSIVVVMPMSPVLCGCFANILFSIIVPRNVSNSERLINFMNSKCVHMINASFRCKRSVWNFVKCLIKLLELYRAMS